jgi:hypothetical protein
LWVISPTALNVHFRINGLGGLFENRAYSFEVHKRTCFISTTGCGNVPVKGANCFKRALTPPCSLLILDAPSNDANTKNCRSRPNIAKLFTMDLRTLMAFVASTNLLLHNLCFQNETAFTGHFVRKFFCELLEPHDATVDTIDLQFVIRATSSSMRKYTALTRTFMQMQKP